MKQFSTICCILYFLLNSSYSQEFREIDKLFPDYSHIPDIYAEEFGYSVDFKDNRAIVGAPFGGTKFGVLSGSAIIYEYDPNAASWKEVKRIIPDDANARQFFGRMVAIEEDIAVVTARQYFEDSSSTGYAYIFAKDHGGINNWGQIARLEPQIVNNGLTNFGGSISLSRDILAIGDSSDHEISASSGAVYIFNRHKGGENNWGQTAKLKSGDAAKSDGFGVSVYISGNTLVVGACLNRTDGIRGGSAYIFEREEDADEWTQLKKLIATDIKDRDHFGRSVSKNNDIIVIGAPGRYSGDQAGAVYLFSKDTGGENNWGQLTKLTKENGIAEDNFGASVTINNDMIVIGSPRDNDLGAIHIYKTDAEANWKEIRELKGEDFNEQKIGEIISVNEDLVMLGFPKENYDKGIVSFVRIDKETDQLGKVITIDGGNSASDQYFGTAVDLDGDIAIIGAYGDDENGRSSGGAYIFSRENSSSDKWRMVTKLSPNDPEEYDLFGRKVAISGDVAIVGAYGSDDHGSSSGSAYIFSKDTGGENNWGEVLKLTDPNGNEDDLFGYDVDVSRDIAVVGAYGDQGFSGAVHIYKKHLGGRNNWGEVTKLRSRNGERDLFGISVAIDEDVLLVTSNGIGRNGETYIFYQDSGGLDNWGEIVKLTANRRQSSSLFGRTLDVSGDLAIIGASQENNRGAVYLFSRNEGGTDNWGILHKMTKPDAEEWDNFGHDVAIDKDILIIGMERASNLGATDGKAFLYAKDQGGIDNWGELAIIKGRDTVVGDNFGTSVALSGQIALIGTRDDEGGRNSGSAYIFSSDENLTSINNTTFASQYEFKLFPNPFKDESLLSWNNVDSNNFEFTIYTMKGQKLRQYSNVKDESLLLKRHQLAEGMYFLHIIDEAGNQGMVRFIVND